MTLRSRFVRITWYLAAFLQLSLPGLATIADARQQDESRGAYAHVESHGTKSCAHVHPDDCVVCRVISASAQTRSSVALVIPAARQAVAARAVVNVSRPSTHPAGDPPQRAPPALS